MHPTSRRKRNAEVTKDTHALRPSKISRMAHGDVAPFPIGAIEGALPIKRAVSSFGLYFSGVSTRSRHTASSAGATFSGMGISPRVEPCARPSAYGRPEIRRRRPAYKHEPHETAIYNAARHSQHYARCVSSVARVSSLAKQDLERLESWAKHRAVRRNAPWRRSIPSFSDTQIRTHGPA